MKLFTLSIFCFLSFHLFSQSFSRVDSLLDKLIEQRGLFEEQGETSKILGEELIKYNNRHPELYEHLWEYASHLDKDVKPYYYTVINVAIGNIDPQFGLDVLYQGINSIDPDDKATLVDFYGNIGANYHVMGMDDQALENSVKALDILTHEKYDRPESRKIWIKRMLLANITEMYLNHRNLPAALKYSQSALSTENPYEDEYRFKFLKILELNLAAKIAHMQGNQELAEKHLLEELAICIELNEIVSKSKVYVNLGNYTDDYAAKLAYHELAYHAVKNTKSNSVSLILAAKSLANTCLDLAENKALREKYFEMKFNKAYFVSKADTLIGNFERNIKHIDSKQDLADLYRQKARLEKLKGNYLLALELNEKFYTLNDSIFSQESKNKLAAIQSSNEIKLMDQEIALKSHTIVIKERQTIILTIGLLLVSILGALLLYQNRLRKRKNAALKEANRINTRFFSILNHDLRRPVGDVIRLLYLKLENPEMLDNTMRERLNKQTLNSAESLLTSMDDLLIWSKGQMQNFTPQKQEVSVSSLFDEFSKLFSAAESISIEFLNPEDVLLFTDIDYLRTIVRNLTSNAIKALADTENAKIVWKSEITNGQKILSISDNGPGGTDEKFKALYDPNVTVGIKTGLGLHLVRDMAQAIGCKITVESFPDKGTIIRIFF